MAEPSVPAKRPLDSEPASSDATESKGELVRVSSLREEVKRWGEEHGAAMRLHKGFVPALSAKMKAALHESLARAKANGRRTLMPQDA